MRISDWSSDVCSSDLNAALPQQGNGEEGTYAHIFFYEPAEATNLQRAIGRHLDDERIRSGLLHLVRLFPPEDVVPEPEFRGVHHLPATAIRSVIEQLCALPRSEEHTSELQSLMRISYAVFCLKNKIE